MAERLTSAEERALRALARCPDCSHAEVAEMLGVTPNRLYVTLARLENAGLVRSRVERDGQHSTRRFGLTPEGLQTILTPPADQDTPPGGPSDDGPPIVGRAPDTSSEG
jgi:DNA-binding MarR family transcriptional regulator